MDNQQPQGTTTTTTTITSTSHDMSMDNSRYRGLSEDSAGGPAEDQSGAAFGPFSSQSVEDHSDEDSLGDAFANNASLDASAVDAPAVDAPAGRKPSRESLEFRAAREQGTKSREHQSIIEVNLSGGEINDKVTPLTFEQAVSESQRTSEATGQAVSASNRAWTCTQHEHLTQNTPEGSKASLSRPDFVLRVVEYRRSDGAIELQVSKPEAAMLLGTATTDPVSEDDSEDTSVSEDQFGELPSPMGHVWRHRADRSKRAQESRWVKDYLNESFYHQFAETEVEKDLSSQAEERLSAQAKRRLVAEAKKRLVAEAMTRFFDPSITRVAHVLRDIFDTEPERFTWAEQAAEDLILQRFDVEENNPPADFDENFDLVLELDREVQLKEGNADDTRWEAREDQGSIYLTDLLAEAMVRRAQSEFEHSFLADSAEVYGILARSLRSLFDTGYTEEGLKRFIEASRDGLGDLEPGKPWILRSRKTGIRRCFVTLSPPSGWSPVDCKEYEPTLIEKLETVRALHASDREVPRAWARLQFPSVKEEIGIMASGGVR